MLLYHIIKNPANKIINFLDNFFNNSINNYLNNFINKILDNEVFCFMASRKIKNHVPNLHGSPYFSVGKMPFGLYIYAFWIVMRGSSTPCTPGCGTSHGRKLYKRLKLMAVLLSTVKSTNQEGNAEEANPTETVNFFVFVLAFGFWFNAN